MAVVSVTFAAVGGGVQVISLDSAQTDILTPSAANQTTTKTTSTNRPIVRIATDSALYVSCGVAPDATVDATRIYVPAGGTEFFATGSGNKVAVVLA